MVYMNRFQIICLNLIIAVTYSLLSLIMKTCICYIIVLTLVIYTCYLEI